MICSLASFTCWKKSLKSSNPVASFGLILSHVASFFSKLVLMTAGLPKRVLLDMHHLGLLLSTGVPPQPFWLYRPDADIRDAASVEVLLAQNQSGFRRHSPRERISFCHVRRPYKHQVSLGVGAVTDFLCSDFAKFFLYLQLLQLVFLFGDGG